MASSRRLPVLFLALLASLFITDIAAAMYAPGSGRFMQRDPLGYPDGLNSYAAYHVLHGGVDPSGTNIRFSLGNSEQVDVGKWTVASVQLEWQEKPSRGLFEDIVSDPAPGAWQDYQDVHFLFDNERNELYIEKDNIFWKIEGRDGLSPLDTLRRTWGEQTEYGYESMPARLSETFGCDDDPFNPSIARHQTNPINSVGYPYLHRYFLDRYERKRSAELDLAARDNHSGGGDSFAAQAESAFDNAPDMFRDENGNVSTDAAARQLMGHAGNATGTLGEIALGSMVPGSSAHRSSGSGVVIGQDQRRVRQAQRELGLPGTRFRNAHSSGYSNYTQGLLERIRIQMQWNECNLVKGNRIYDIGVSRTRNRASIYYWLEQQHIQDEGLDVLRYVIRAER